MMTTGVVVAVKGALALAGTAAVAALMRRAPAAWRHLAWTAGFVALAALTVLELPGVELPALRVAAPAWTVPTALEPPAERPGAGGARPAGLEDAPAGGTEGSPTDGRVGAGPAGDAAAGVTVPGQASAPSTVPLPEAAAPGPGGAGAATLPAVPAWPRLLAALWGAGLLALLARLVRGHRAARRTARVAGPAPRAIRGRVPVLAERVGVERPVDVRIHPRVPVPLVTGFLRPVILLPGEARSWSPATLDHVLLHELAHVGRGDPFVHALAEVVRAVHWPNPLAWTAVRRLRLESEKASDDRVLAAGGRPSGYAGDLLRVARGLRGGGGPRLAGVAMARTPELATRLHAILDPERRRGGAGAGACFATVAAALAVAATLAAATPAAAHPDGAGPATRPHGEATAPTAQEAPAVCAFEDSERGVSRHITANDDRFVLRVERGDCRFDLTLRGEVTFGEDDRSVVALDPGATFEMEERDGRAERRIRLDGRPGGMERRYWRDGEARSWGPEAEAWLAQVLPELFRHTTLNARSRVRRILDREGVDGVLDEVDRMETDHVARAYVELLVEMAELDEDDAVRIMERAAAMDADHHKASLLESMAEHQGLGTRRLQQPFLEAALSMDADHHVRRVLERLLRQDGLTAEQRDAVIRAAARMDADHHKASLLEDVARDGGPSASGRRAFLETLHSIDADHHRRSVVEAFLDGGRLSPSEVGEVLALARDVDADHHKAAILSRVARDYALEGVAARAFAEAAGSVEADHHLRQVLETLVGSRPPDDERVSLALELAEGVGSDHHRLAVLEAVARARTLTGDLRARYLELASEMSSRREEEARRALGRG